MRETCLASGYPFTGLGSVPRSLPDDHRDLPETGSDPLRHRVVHHHVLRRVETESYGVALPSGTGITGPYRPRRGVGSHSVRAVFHEALRVDLVSADNHDSMRTSTSKLKFEPKILLPR